MKTKEYIIENPINMHNISKELFRCKDCKYWRKLVLNTEEKGHCIKHNLVTDKEWPCEDGEEGIKND